MMDYKYGDVILVDFNPVKGSEIAKIRPCILISRDIINKYSPLMIVIPITGNTERILPFHIHIKPSKKNGLKKSSKALPEQIKSLDKKRIIKRLGTIEKHYLDEVENKVQFVINQKELL